MGDPTLGRNQVLYIISPLKPTPASCFYRLVRFWRRFPTFTRMPRTTLWTKVILCWRVCWRWPALVVALAVAAHSSLCAGLRVCVSEESPPHRPCYRSAPYPRQRALFGPAANQCSASSSSLPCMPCACKMRRSSLPIRRQAASSSRKTAQQDGRAWRMPPKRCAWLLRACCARGSCSGLGSATVFDICLRQPLT